MRSASGRRNFIGGEIPQTHPTKLFPLLAEQNSRSRVVVCGCWVSFQRYSQAVQKRLQYVRGFVSCIVVKVFALCNPTSNDLQDERLNNNRRIGTVNLNFWKPKIVFSVEKMKTKQSLPASSLLQGLRDVMLNY